MSKNVSEPTVHVVDDDEAVRDALEMLIRSIGLPVKSFNSAISFLDQYDNEARGCLLLDIRMPSMSGLELQDELIARNSSLSIIFITGHGDIPMAVRAIKKGAIDFISKPFRDQDLIECIQRALLINEESRDRINLQHQINENLAQLTQREKEIMDLMIEGLANKVIALELDISQRTVEVHRASVMTKMQAGSLAHLVKMITSMNL
ncbi:MAG: response regulator transcription factor [Gammaproteobacteria bacterium]|uniref:response regulator transcription factor n=1 Tax=Imperialibacter sp. TaxID=2038411 RepID=UPI0032ED5320